MSAAEPTGDVREQIHRHGVYGFTGTEIACRCDRWWRSTAEHEAHLADAVLALPAVRDAVAAQETVRRVHKVVGDWSSTAADDPGQAAYTAMRAVARALDATR